MLMFNFRMQREVAEKHLFKRFWLEPVVKYKLQSAMLLLRAYTLSKADPYQPPWCLLVAGQPRHMEKTSFSLLWKVKAQAGKNNAFLITFEKASNFLLFF